MPMQLVLNSFPWQDRGLEDLAQKAGEWGYHGLDLWCGADHLAVQRALDETDYCQQLLNLLERQETRLVALSNHAIGQLLGDGAAPHLQSVVPDYVWGDGDPAGVRARALEELQATAKVAQRLGISLVIGASGSPLTPLFFDRWAPAHKTIDEAYKSFARQWSPLLDGYAKTGVRFALEIRPGQMAFDLYSAERVLQSLQGHEGFGFALNPAQLHWQGVDPIELCRAFPNRIAAVIATDAAVTLNGRSGILGSHLPAGDFRRGWSSRCPGHGGVDWPALFRTLQDIGFEGPVSVAIDDAGMDRDYGAAEAVQFLRRLDFPTAPKGGNEAFGEAL